MKNLLSAALLLFTATAAVNSQDVRMLTVLHTNDFHSHLQGYAPESAYTPGVPDNDYTVGGFSRIAYVIEKTKAEADHPVLTVDAGDCLMGTLFHAMEQQTGFQIPLMRQAGYDVLAVGNHDFDFGSSVYADILKASAKRGEIPQILLGNVVTDNEDPADDNFESVIRDGIIKEYTIIERDGIKTGIFSLLGRDADESAPYAPPVRFKKIIPEAKRIVRELKKQNCDVIICLSHSGIVKDKKGRWTGEDVKLAKRVKGIDLIISGHTHNYLAEPLMVKNVPVVIVGSSGRFVGKAELEINGKKVKLASYSTIPVDDALKADTIIQAEIEQQKRVVDSLVLRPLNLAYDMPVATAAFPVVYDEFMPGGESNLGPLIADAIYNYVNTSGPGTDIAMVAAGVLRDPIQPGTQSVADLFRVMSLGSGKDNIPGYPLSQLWITGKELKNIAEILIMSSASTPSHYCYYSHLKITVDPEGGIFRKIKKIELTDRKGNTREVNTSKEDTTLYSIVANSYMLDFVGIIKKQSFGLINVVPKNAGGSPVSNMDDAVMDFDPSAEGIQEGKEWLALVKYLQQFPSPVEGGLPAIPSYYQNPDRSLFELTDTK